MEQPQDFFAAFERGATVAKADFKRQASALRRRLLEAQVAIREAGVPAIVLFAGVDRGGKSESANLLNEWMDPRYRRKLARWQGALTDDDWRNRERRPDYEHAVHDMIEKTSTPNTPLTLVAANDKRHARIAVLRTVCRALEAALS